MERLQESGSNPLWVDQNTIPCPRFAGARFSPGGRLVVWKPRELTVPGLSVSSSPWNALLPVESSYESLQVRLEFVARDALGLRTRSTGRKVSPRSAQAASVESGSVVDDVEAPDDGHPRDTTASMSHPVASLEGLSLTSFIRSLGAGHMVSGKPLFHDHQTPRDDEAASEADVRSGMEVGTSAGSVDSDSSVDVNGLDVGEQDSVASQSTSNDGDSDSVGSDDPLFGPADASALTNAAPPTPATNAKWSVRSAPADDNRRAQQASSREEVAHDTRMAAEWLAGGALTQVELQPSQPMVHQSLQSVAEDSSATTDAMNLVSRLETQSGVSSEQARTAHRAMSASGPAVGLDLGLPTVSADAPARAGDEEAGDDELPVGSTVRAQIRCSVQVLDVSRLWRRSSALQAVAERLGEPTSSVSATCKLASEVCERDRLGLEAACWKLMSLGVGESESWRGLSDPEDTWAHHPLGAEMLRDIADVLARSGGEQTCAMLGAALAPALASVVSKSDRPSPVEQGHSILAQQCKVYGDERFVASDWHGRAVFHKAAAALHACVSAYPLLPEEEGGTLEVVAITPETTDGGLVEGKDAEMATLEGEDASLLNASKSKIPLICALCCAPTRGLTCVCALCGHGGHWEHMNDWFRTSSECPSGCGCTCDHMSFQGASSTDLESV
jgi:hypothetical protein